MKKRIPAGTAESFDAGGKRICIVNHQEELYALDDRCPHQGAPLSEGHCSFSGNIICPRHKYAYDIETGKGPGYMVEVYQLRKEEDGVYVGIPKTIFGIFSDKEKPTT